MVKFIVFQFDTYDPGGGLGDVTEGFYTIEEAPEPIFLTKISNNN